MMLVTAPAKPVADQEARDREAGEAVGEREQHAAEQRQQRHRGDRAARAEAIEGEACRHLHQRRGEHHRADHEADLGRAEAEGAIELERHHAARGAMQLGDHAAAPRRRSEPVACRRAYPARSSRRPHRRRRRRPARPAGGHTQRPRRRAARRRRVSRRGPTGERARSVGWRTSPAWTTAGGPDPPARRPRRRRPPPPAPPGWRTSA